jgi:hypothetical protein
MPAAMALEQNTESTQRRTEFLLSCMYGSFVPEWANIYRNIVLFVSKIYEERAKAFDME